MASPLRARFDDGISRLDDGSTYDSATATPPPDLLLPAQPLTLLTAIEFWEISKNRAQETLPVWNQYVPALKVGGLGAADLETLIDGFEPLVQARTAAQDVVDAAFRAMQDALQRMRVLGTRVPQIIEGHLDDNAGIMKDVDDLFRTSPRAESSILKRLRMLLPVWTRANAALAAMTPPQEPITRAVGGTVYTVALATALLDSYTTLIKTFKDEEEQLDVAREALRTHDRAADRLNKNWYKIAKATADPGTAFHTALAGITTESGSTPLPEVIEIDTVTQGGETGLQVLLAYVPGGGDHATTRLVRWKVTGVDADFTHSVPLDASGNALGPFAVGQEVQVLTEVANSSGTITSAVRTITLVEPVV